MRFHGWSLLALLVAGCPASAEAAVRFVDGACLTSGTGVDLACGPSGPFRTPSAAQLAMACGDTLDIRGAHDGFDGEYFDALTIAAGTPLPGKVLNCPDAAPATFRWCPASLCPLDTGPPVLRGITLRADWVADGDGVFHRTMEATPVADRHMRPRPPATACNPSQPATCDFFDPMILVQLPSEQRMLAYAGDGVLAPPEGRWSYHPATHRLFVNPLGDAEPTTDVYVPHFGWNIYAAAPSRNLVFQDLVLEGSRVRSIVLDRVPRVTVSGGAERYVHNYFIHGNAAGLIVEDNLGEYGCRGSSLIPATSGGDGCFGYRVFGMHNGGFFGDVVRHLGADGTVRLAGGTAHVCPQCDPPWDQRNGTYVAARGLAYQVKQTETFTFEDNLAEDVQSGCYSLDVSRHGRVERNACRRAARNVSVMNFTPTGSCTASPPDGADFCFNSDHVIRDNVSEALADPTDCGLTLRPDSLGRIHTRCEQSTVFGFVPAPCAFFVHESGNCPGATTTTSSSTTTSSTTTSSSTTATTAVTTSSTTATTSSTTSSTTVTTTSSTTTTTCLCPCACAL